jgi:VanZ family protein
MRRFPVRLEPGVALLLFSVFAATGLLLPLPPELQLQWLSNLAHAPLFALWAWLACSALSQRKASDAATLAKAAALGTALAFLSELLQLWIPGRWADWRDLLLNLLGLATGLTVWRLKPCGRPSV